ncbi:MAG TPA: hypothetical protein VG939_13990 [Caulobacteraceae bacterium]|nr:hypothetical protein [Caulobacteraceae bacterium]
MGEVEWAGLKFLAVARQDAPQLRAPGLYALVARGGAGMTLLFAGEAEDIARAVGPQHPAWQAALDAGFNEIHVALVSAPRLDRLQLLARVTRAHTPTLNADEPARAVG